MNFTRLQQYWNNRVDEHGHTGWSNAYLYDYDQKLRINRIVHLIGKNNVNRIFDFGCGTGEVAAAFAEIYPDCEIVCSDVSDKVLNIASNRLRNYSNVEFYCGELDLIADQGKKYDLILCVTVLQHIEKTKLSPHLSVLKDMLTENGKIIILENIYRSAKSTEYINVSFDRQMWISTITEAGLHVNAVDTYPHWGVIFTESILPLLSGIYRRLKIKKADSVNGDSSELSQAREGRLSAMAIKIILAGSYIFDYVLKLLPPNKWRRYLLLVVSKT